MSYISPAHYASVPQKKLLSPENFSPDCHMTVSVTPFTSQLKCHPWECSDLYLRYSTPAITLSPNQSLLHDPVLLSSWHYYLYLLIFSFTYLLVSLSHRILELPPNWSMHWHSDSHIFQRKLKHLWEVSSDPVIALFKTVPWLPLLLT